MCDSQFYDQQTATDTANIDANQAIGAQNWVKSELRLVYPDTIGTEIKMFPQSQDEVLRFIDDQSIYPEC